MKYIHTYGAPVFAPDYSTIVLATKMCTNSDEHSMYIILKHILTLDQPLAGG